jgi:hypothetical protein
MFGGKVRVGIDYRILMAYESSFEKSKYEESMRTILRYSLMIFGEEEDNMEAHKELAETILEHWYICKAINEGFEEREKALKHEWEPKVERIKPGIKVEEFVLLLLKEVF